MVVAVAVAGQLHLALAARVPALLRVAQLLQPYPLEHRQAPPQEMRPLQLRVPAVKAVMALVVVVVVVVVDEVRRPRKVRRPLSLVWSS